MLPFAAAAATIPPMRARRYFLGLVSSLLLLPLAGCKKAASSGEAAGAAPALRVGMDLSYPPFETRDPSGKPDGVGVKMSEALAQYLGRPLEIVPMGFEGLIPALKNGHIDLILSSMTATEERAQSISFSDPYAFTGLALLVRKDSDIQSVDDLKKPGRIITAKATTTGETWAIKNLPEAKRVVFEDQNLCALEVSQGRADAFIYDQLSIFKYYEQYKDTTRGLLKPFVEESWAVGVAKGNDALRQQVNAFLVFFRSENGMQKLSEHYLQDEKKLLDEMGIPFILR